ncbi:unnamed protein product [Ixodes hexagonus]
MATVVVLGGGISGLATTHYLTSLGKDVVKKVILVERKARLGGWIRSSRFPDGTVYEHGPHGLRTGGESGRNTLQLIEELGLRNQVLPVPSSSPAGRQQLVLSKGRLGPLPISFGRLLWPGSPFTTPLLVPLLRDLFWAGTPDQDQDECVHDFATRRFNRQVADYIMDPVVRGICGGSSHEVSLRALLPNVFRAAREHGSVVRGQLRQARAAVAASRLVQTTSSEPAGSATHATSAQNAASTPAKATGAPVHATSTAAYSTASAAEAESVADAATGAPASPGSSSSGWAMWSLRNGLQQLCDTLTLKLEEDPSTHVYVNEHHVALQRDSDGHLMVSFAESTTDADHVFSCIPSRRLSQLLTHDWPELASMLLGIPTVHVASVNLEYKGKVLPQEAPGFLVPSHEEPHLLSVLFDSCCFPEHDGQYDTKTRITCLLGGRWFKQTFGEVDTVDPQALLESAQLAAQSHLGISQSPVRHSIDLLKDCLPQYLVGHVKKVSSIQQHIADRGLNLTLLGASYQGLGVNECIYNARLAVEDYLAKLRI